MSKHKKHVDLNGGWIRGLSGVSDSYDYYPPYSLKEIIEAADYEPNGPPQITDLYIKHYDSVTYKVTHCITLKEAKRLLKLNQL